MAFYSMRDKPYWIIAQGKEGEKHVVVAVDYFTKWIKVEALSLITLGKIKELVNKNIVCRYGVLHTIVSNNGK